MSKKLMISVLLKLSNFAGFRIALQIDKQNALKKGTEVSNSLPVEIE